MTQLALVIDLNQKLFHILYYIPEFVACQPAPRSQRQAGP